MVGKKNTADLFEVLGPDGEEPESTEYKDKLRNYVLSGQIKELYGKIITESELNKMSEQECENVNKICEMRIAQSISKSVVDGIIDIGGSLFTRILPIDDKEKYISELKDNYVINAELKNVTGSLTSWNGKLMALGTFALITFSHLGQFKKQLDKELDQDAKEIEKELVKELDKELE
jgi:hypothetical protein